MGGTRSSPLMRLEKHPLTRYFLDADVLYPFWRVTPLGGGVSKSGPACYILYLFLPRRLCVNEIVYLKGSRWYVPGREKILGGATL